MKHTNIVVVFMVLFLTGLAQPSLGQQGAAPPTLVIERSTQRVLGILESHTEAGEAVSVTELVEELLAALEPVVDFHSIARAVMGRHGKGATTAQIEAFSVIFRESLVSLYARSFRAFEIRETRVLDMPAAFEPATARKATVRMEATTGDGKIFTLSYSMRRDGDGNWVVRNIIVDGINLGLTYMNQFDGAMERLGAVDEVITQWPEEMGDRTVADEQMR